MNHRLKRLVSSTLAFFLSGAVLAPLARAAGNPYLEHPIEDASYWSNYYKNHPELLNKLRFGDGGGQYLYDRLNQKMVNGYQFTDTTVPFTYSVYDENGSQLARTSVRPVIPGPPKLFLSAIPMDYQNKYWQCDIDRKEQIEVDPRHETERNPDDYHFGKSGNRFKKARDNFDDIEAHWVYSGHMTDPIHLDEKYANIKFCLTYGYDIRILSKSVWPVKYVEDTFFVPISSTGSIRTNTYEGELYKIQLREEQKANVHEVYDNGEYTCQEAYSYYEIELAGKRSFVKERNRQSSKLKNHEKRWHTPSGKKDYYTYRDVKSLDALAEKDYYVIDDLEAMPGYYYCIHIHTLDSYHETAEAHGAGTVRPEAAAVLAEYNRLKPIVTEKLVKELAALKPVVSFSPPNGTSGKPPVVQEKTTHAETTPGEDKGVDIKPEVFTNPGEDEGVPLDETVAVSVGGALIGAGLAGLSRNKRKKKKKKNEKEEKKAAPTYKMYVSKGFGDAIQRGAAPVKVYARIAQVVEGKEYGCPELTAKIQASGSHLTVKPIGIEDGYLCAEVSAAVDEAAKEADVIFTLAGAGGAFVRKIIFRLTGNPEIKFPALSEDGKNWLMDAGLDTVDMIAGGRGRDRLRFVFQDAATEPTDIQFLDADGFDISYEKDAGKPFTYYACIQNKTEPIPKESKVFADPVFRTVTIEATFPGELKVRGRFTINLYPMGIAVFPVESRKLSGKEIVQNGRLDVVSYRVNDSWNTGLEKEIRASAFYLHFGAERADGTAVPVEEVGFEFAKKLKAEDTRSEGVASLYSYTVGSGNEDKSHVFFLPETVSPELVGTHEMLLEVRASGGGKQESGLIPLRVLGLDPGPPVEWYREHQLLLDAITRYYPEDLAPAKRRDVEENFNSPEVCDVAELRILRRTVILWAQTYWRQQENLAQQEKDLYWARVWTLNVWGAKKLKWAGDVAFTILICYKLGADHEAWLSPVKDFAADAIGNLIADVNYGNGEYRYWKNFESKLFEVLEKLALGRIKGEEMTLSYSADTRKVFLKAGFVMTCFLVLDVAKNYREMEPGERDFWKAFTKAFSNLTLEAMKKLFGAYLDKWLNGPSMQKFFRSKFMQVINSKLKGATRAKYLYKGKPLVVRYQGKLVSIQGAATGNVDVARDAARGLKLHLSDGRTVRIPNVTADPKNTYLGYIEIITETLGKIFEESVSFILEESVKNAEADALDDNPRYYRQTIDLRMFDPSAPLNAPPLTVEIDLKKFCNNPLTEGFDIVFRTFFGCLKLQDLVLNFLPDPMQELQKLFDTTLRLWEYLTGQTDGNQIDWSIFDD